MAGSCFWLGLAAALVAQPPPSFVVHTPERALAPAALTKLADDWSVEIGGGWISEGDWYSLRRAGTPLPLHPRKTFALLTSGDRIPLEPGAPLRIEDERLFLQPAKAKAIAVPVAF